MPAANKLTVIADTREQRPFDFDSEQFDVVRGTLKTGDYTLVGLEDVVCVERKELGDFVGTMIRDWIRFRKELYRLAAFDLAVIVVEADVQDVLQKRYESEANPHAVLGRANSCLIDHGVPVIFAGHRPYSTEYVERLLILAWKKYGGYGGGA